ncbi:MAG: type II secretion system protein N [Halioglobus sp.]
MIEWIVSSALTLVRSDNWWYACSLLTLASGLTLGVYDLYLQAPSPKQKAFEVESNRPSRDIMNHEDEMSQRYADYRHWDFFGVPEKVSEELDIKALPKTELDLKLIGTFTSDKDFSSIVIRNDKGESKRVFLGDEIIAGVNIHTINETQAVIIRGSILETLNLYNLDARNVGRNPNRPEYRNEVARPMKIISDRHEVRTGYQNDVDEQRVNRQKRRERYLAAIKPVPPSS